MAAQTPKDPRPPLKLASFLCDQQQYAQSVQSNLKALELDPNNVNACTDLGTAYFYTGRSHEAPREYRKSLEINPTHKPTIMNMIIVNLEDAHDLPAAQQAWDRLRETNPKNPAPNSLRQKLDAARGSTGQIPSGK
jgi:Flp pilus assembly protein TadD